MLLFPCGVVFIYFFTSENTTLELFAIHLQTEASQ